MMVDQPDAAGDANGVDKYIQEATGRIEHLAENSLISAEEEQWKVGRPNGKTTAMDKEADNTTVPRNEDSDLQPDTGKEDRASASGLSNMDREGTSVIETEMGTAPPRGLDKRNGDQYLQPETDSIQGKETRNQPNVISDANMTTDNTPIGYNNIPNTQIGPGNSEEATEQRDDIHGGRNDTKQ
jgi:hypothetical protein